MAKTKKKKFSARQQKYKQNILMGMSKYNAAKAAGYSEATARSHTKQLDERVAMPDVLEQQGLTDQILTQKLMQLMNATKVIGYLHQYKKVEKGGVEKIQPDEVVSNEFIDIPDWTARAKGLEIALKLKGLLKDKVDHQVDVKYTQMARITIEQKPMELDLGDLPDSIKKRMK